MHGFKHLKTKELFTKPNHSCLHKISIPSRPMKPNIWIRLKDTTHEGNDCVSPDSAMNQCTRKTLAMTLKVSYLRRNCVHPAAQALASVKNGVIQKVKDVIKMPVSSGFLFSFLHTVPHPLQNTTLKKTPVMSNPH